MADLAAEKSRAAQRAVSEVQDGMLVGLGTGSTSAFAIQELGRRIASEGLRITAVATSDASEKLAKSLSIPLIQGASVSRLDIAIDGVDEIDSQLQAIKGGGGALFREKIIAAAADRMIVIADSTKLVTKLGKFKLPVEVLPYAESYVSRILQEMGMEVIRREKDGTPTLTDQGNLIFDLNLHEIDAPTALASTLAGIPGVIEHGLFLTEIDLLILAQGDELRTFARP